MDLQDFSTLFDNRKHLVSQLERKIPRVPEKHFIYAASSQFSSWRVLIINLATFVIYFPHDNAQWQNASQHIVLTQESSLDDFCHVIFDVNIDVMDVRGRPSGICCFVASIMVICNILLKGSFLRTFGNASSQFSSWRVLIINLATFVIYFPHDNQLCIKSKKFTGIFNNKLNKKMVSVVKQGWEILKVHFMRVITCMNITVVVRTRTDIF
jgi:hypothetical protein